MRTWISRTFEFVGFARAKGENEADKCLPFCFRGGVSFAKLQEWQSTSKADEQNFIRFILTFGTCKAYKP